MRSQVKIESQDVVACAHCGEDCINEQLEFDSKWFCCTGCQTVYEILSTNDMCDYYGIDTPKVTVKQTEFGNKYAFLDTPEIEEKLYSFIEGDYRVVKLFVPIIHCASCIWLLENLGRLLPEVSSSKVNFVKKVVTINFNRSDVSLRQVVELLASLGYPPDINLEGYKEEKSNKRSRTLLIKLGVAGFSFGNIMLMSFPEYFSFQFQDEAQYLKLFAWLNLLLSLPVFFYCSTEYFVSAIKGLRHKIVNIDVPISLGIVVLFARSTYEIMSGTGVGYLDSMTGLVFFLLIGKWFQNKTYEALSFERDYKSYFPLAITLVEDGTERSVLANHLKKGDEIRIRNGELIPADSILISNKASIDYSFVTGESKEVEKKKGDFLYAGGRQEGETIRMIVQKEVSQSYLTDLWNQSAFNKDNKARYSSIIDRVSQYFTLIIISIASLSAGYWLLMDPSLAIETFTAVLIIACPCALALSLPFTMGNSIRILGKLGFYLKNALSLESLAETDTVVFDKTGTITGNAKDRVLFVGETRLSLEELKIIKSLCSSSTHPISSSIAKSIESETTKIEDYNEIPGKGIEGNANELSVKIGSAGFCHASDAVAGTHAFVSVNGEIKGHFSIRKETRHGLEQVLKDLRNHGTDLHLLSGDTSTNQDRIISLFPEKKKVFFNQSPQDKLNYINQLKSKGKKVLMLGDGLNDAGALKASNAGIAVSEDVYAFSPACDGILEADRFDMLDRILHFSKQSIIIVKWSFALSFLYNIVGMYFAVQGMLSPVVAAILMPLSSITIVVFVTIATNLMGKIVFKKQRVLTEN
ncbi:MAG: heavy metal translocating P-type ATPase [Crocinitomicaceae bacterium]|nr:heavy metal translocating P-type ATPase [Crocinitomicaceae bacterium]